MRYAYILFLTLIIVVSSCKQSDPIEKVFQQVWSDEFDGNELDLNKWEIQLGNGAQYGLTDWGNNEEQYYQEDNVSVSLGNLWITSRAESVGGYNFTSGRIRSLNKADFKYGKIEASIRFDDTPGLWHAFWMLPSDPVDSWPISGEIDILEYVGNQPNEIFNTVHFADGLGNHRWIGLEYPFFTSEFHLYAVEWDENSITWFIDGEERFQVLRNNDLISATWPFDAEFHMLLNTAVGGNLGGDVNTQSFQTDKFMQVDFVRVYQAL